ncbi:hypothetical protein ETU10_02160 [Apibacter muscae]|uniref:CDP-alcohol phosphatidyltransferase family protein n=1 Tax=Apibacter muscae TaxID=2509004 RepID=UPI0011AC0428|nr:CDP-alcohol phosphatidyltransferase family protein [Apibacter muscae]TWP24786.1 hypothetical protein ETU10_02160 [Apibacter muscae]
MIKQLPNFLTLLNLLCGSLACIFTITNSAIEYILILLLFSLIFDFFDGFVARAVNASGSLGKELDSLADVISFGLLPGILMLNLLDGDVFLSTIKGLTTLDFNFNSFYFLIDSLFKNASIIGLIITLASAYRLAKFNLDEDQTYYFKGLPTPANTLFIFSLYWLIHKNPESFWSNTYLLIFISIFSSIILVSNLPLFALKFKNLKWNDNSLVFSYIITSILIFIFLGLSSIPFLILLYILLSILFRKKIISNEP